MEDNRAEQKEALETLMEFNTRLVKNMEIITKELSGARLEDTDAFLEDIIKAMNWEIQVMNGTMEFSSVPGEGTKVTVNLQLVNQNIKTL